MSDALDDELYDQLTQLCEEGEELFSRDDMVEAIAKYREAWELLPEPREEWEAATWIQGSIGDAHFSLGDFPATIEAFEHAQNCPNGFDNPFVRLRLGQACYELGRFDEAAAHFIQAYHADGIEVFEDDDPKYLEFLIAQIEDAPCDDRPECASDSDDESDAE